MIRCRLRRGDLFFAPALTEQSERQGVPVGRRVAKGHGETVKWYQVQIDGSEVSCHDEIVSVRAKNKAPARRPAALLTLSRQQDLSGGNKI